MSVWSPFFVEMQLETCSDSYPWCDCLALLVSCSGLPKVIFLAVAEGEGEAGKSSALEVKAEGEAEGLVFCI